MFIDEMVVGLLSGTVATGPMTMAMEGLHRLLPPLQRDPLPPRQITQKVSHHAGLKRHLSERQAFTLTMLAHFAYGGVTGGMYWPLARRLKLPAVSGGIGWGLLVWAGSYLGLLPAVGLYPPAHKDTFQRQAIMVLAHVVWGATLGLTARTLQSSGDDSTAMSGAGAGRRVRLRG
jgi:uncharacterized membrane protein YagU involved in acid resistance